MRGSVVQHFLCPGTVEDGCVVKAAAVHAVGKIRPPEAAPEAVDGGEKGTGHRDVGAPPAVDGLGEGQGVGTGNVDHPLGAPGLTRLFQGTVPVKELRGPIGIAHIGTKVAKQGWSYLMFFLGLISVNLAVVNFLPIPITDGGLMLFLIVEKVKGSPVSPRVQTAAFFIGLALIGSVFLITLFHDTTRLFSGG